MIRWEFLKVINLLSSYLFQKLVWSDLIDNDHWQYNEWTAYVWCQNLWLWQPPCWLFCLFCLPPYLQIGKDVNQRQTWGGLNGKWPMVNGCHARCQLLMMAQEKLGAIWSSVSWTLQHADWTSRWSNCRSTSYHPRRLGAQTSHAVNSA